MTKPTFLIVHPFNKKIPVKRGSDLLSALIKGGIFITSNCSGKGICKKCKVKIIKGNFYSEETEEKKKGLYLACKTKIMGDIEIEILPETNIPETIEGKVFSEEEIQNILNFIKNFSGFSPIVKKIFLKIQHPSFEDTISDYERLLRELRKNTGENNFNIDIINLRKLPDILRKSVWELTATIVKSEKYYEIVNIEPENNSLSNFGIAVDIGTTTIAASLLDMNKGTILKTESTFNRQASFGEDIISRIVFAEKRGGLEKLHEVIVDTINGLIINLTEKCRISVDDISCVSISGNMTMVHLFLKINPSFLRKEPYIPVANTFPLFKSSEIGIKINPRGILAIIPGGYPYVGGDITSGIIVSGIYKEEALSLFVDIGTNGEIVVGNKDFLVCCAASAGPAFEGSGMKNGVRVIKGAIHKLQIENNNVYFETIGNTIPTGICGSGYIELIYELFKNKIVNRNGMFIGEHKRITEKDGMKEFIVVENETGKGHIVINQSDIENLIRAKGAIFSAISTILKTVGLKVEDIKKFYIAGGFGNSINISKAIEIGLLPELPEERFIFLGNTSLKGAIGYILSEDFRKLSREIIKKLTYIDLSRSPIYMEEYMKSLFIPHTDYL